jgi:hypothetical protein
MRNIYTAFANWLRVCKTDGYLYICVPHETYYEKGIWPSVNNKDHKHSFTLEQKSSMPENVVVKDFLSYFNGYIDVIDVRENLKNYDFNCDKGIDQTLDVNKMVCAQIDIIVQKKKKMEIEQIENFNKYYFREQIIYFYPKKLSIQLQSPIKRIVKKAIIHNRH